MNSPPDPLWLYRLLPLAQLPGLLQRGTLYAPNHPEAVATDRTSARRLIAPPCGPGGVLDDYLDFDFGPAPLSLQIGQEGSEHGDGGLPVPVRLYLLTSLPVLQEKRIVFIFTDGDPAVGYTDWYDTPNRLDRIDWHAVKTPPWEADGDDDQRRRKQAKLLVWQTLPWSLIRGIAVPDADSAYQVEALLARYPRRAQPKVVIRPGWYRP